MTDVRDDLIRDTCDVLDFYFPASIAHPTAVSRVIIDHVAGLVRDRKLRILVEAGYEIWRSEKTGLFHWVTQNGPLVMRPSHPLATLSEAIDAAWQHHQEAS